MSITCKLLKKLLFCGSKSFAKNIQQGHIWVRVGVQEPQMFELDAHFLKHPLFEDLLNFSMEEFGCSYDGALRIACDIDLFLHLLQILKSGNASVDYMDLQLLKNRLYTNRAQLDQHL